MTDRARTRARRRSCGCTAATVCSAGMRSALVLVLLAVVLVGCSPSEEPLVGLRTCDVLVAGDDFGNTIDVPEADTEIFSRPGRYVGEEAEAVSMRSGALHVSRSRGPCGQHDLFVSLDDLPDADVAWCAVVVGRAWSRELCGESLVVPQVVETRTPGGDGWVTVVRAPGPEVSHVLLDTPEGPVAAFVHDGFALGVFPLRVRGVEVVEYDGDTRRVR